MTSSRYEKDSAIVGASQLQPFPTLASRRWKGGLQARIAMWSGLCVRI